MDDVRRAADEGSYMAVLLGRITKLRAELVGVAAVGDYKRAGVIADSLQATLRGTLDAYQHSRSVSDAAILPIMLQYSALLADTSLTAIGSGDVKRLRGLVEQSRIIGEEISKLVETTGFGGQQDAATWSATRYGEDLPGRCADVGRLVSLGSWRCRG